MRTANILLFLVFLFAAVSLSAQTNFLKGYYITHSQDTIHGYVDYRSEKRNYRVCVFKRDLSAETERLYPQEINGFGVENKDLYETYIFINGNEKSYVFFKVIIRGKLSLLRHKSTYFAMNANGEVFNISKRTEVSEGKSKKDYYGLGVLKFLMKDCAEITSSVLEREYKLTPDFPRLFNKYNSCIGSPFFETEEIKIKPRVDLGLQVAPTVTMMDLKIPIDEAKLDPDLSFSAGGYASFFLPRVDEDFRFLLEASYSRFSQYSYFSFQTTNNDLIINYSCLKVPVFIRYNLKRFFFDGGMQNQFILNEDLKWRVEAIDQNIVSTTDVGITSNKWTYGYLAGIGVKHQIPNYTLRSSVRYSHAHTPGRPNTPVFHTIELCFSVQLSK